jgi:thioredoxin 2
MAGRAVVLKVDTEQHPELAARYRVQGIPNFAVFAGGQMVFQQAGLVDAETMKGWLERAG